MKHLILTRFNVLVKTSMGLPSDEWIDHRMHLFEQLCFPSMASQTQQDFDWILFVHPQTKPAILDRLKYLQKRRTFIIHCSDNPWRKALAEVVKLYASNSQELITTRLDNDDVLHNEFVMQVQARLKGLHNTWLNFEDGLQLGLDGLHSVSHPSNPFLSLSEDTRICDPRTALGKSHCVVAAQEHVIHVSGYRAWLQVVHDRNVANYIAGSSIPHSHKDSGKLLAGFCQEVTSYIEGLYDKQIR